MPGTPRPQAVMPYRLSQLAADLAVPLTGEDVELTGVTHASSDVRAGDLYAALPGARRHGGEFAAAAAAAGAVAILTDPAGRAAAEATGLPTLTTGDPRAVLAPAASTVYGNPASRLSVLGITGTAGKTSTAYLIESGLQAAGERAGLISTVETRIGDLVMDSVRTTPEAPDLHALLATAVERGVTTVVMEVSSHALALNRVDGMRFAVGGYTMFGQDHLDFHTDSADYFAAKAKLFDGRCEQEILNLDEPPLRPLFTPRTISYSAAGNPAADWWASDVRPDGFGERFTAHGPASTVPVRVSLPGRHNVANALLALATLVTAGVDAQAAARGITACSGPPGRLERLDTPGEVLGVVDFAHKPDAVVAALAGLRQVATARGGRLLCLVGSGGDRDRSKRPAMGAAAAHGADLVIVTDVNPRTEDPAVIRAAVRAGAEAAGTAAKIIEIVGRQAAMDEAARLATTGDVLVVFGKGHERFEDVGGQFVPFDDRVQLTAALTAAAASR